MSFTSLNCPHCRAENVGARISSGGQLPDQGDEARYFFTAICRKCAFPTIIIARRVPGRLPDGPPLVAQVCKTGRDPIPNFIDPIDMIPAPVASVAPDNLPDNVASAFSEAKDCLRRGAVLSASMALRITLERAVRASGSGAEGNLKDRLVKLVTDKGLPEELATWAAEIEMIQGKATDADEDPAVDALLFAADFTEMFLICAFTLPARIENRRKRLDPETGMKAPPPGPGPFPALAGPGPRAADNLTKAWDDDRALQPARRIAGPGM